MTTERLLEDRDRLFSFDAIQNLRDIGGYYVGLDHMVRWRRIFRSGTLAAASQADIDFVVGDLGVKSVIDLRQEHEMDGVRWTECSGRSEVRVPMPDPGELVLSGEASSLAASYVRLIESDGDAFVKVLTLLAELPAPVMIHGTWGKDRTGLVVALLLDILGVSDNDIATDHALTEIDRNGVSTWTSAEWIRWSAERSTIDLALRVFRECTGGIDRWLERRTGSGETANTLRRRYLVHR